MALGDYEQIDPATGMLLPADVVPEMDLGGPLSGMYAPSPAEPTMDDQLAGAEQTLRTAEPAQPPPEIHGGAVGIPFSQRARQEGLDMIGAADDYRVVKSPRPLYHERKEMLTTTGDAMQRGDAAQRELLGEEAETARWMAAEQDQHAQKMQDYAIDERARQFAEAERREQIFQQTEAAAAAEHAAVQKLVNAPPEDPGRWWADASHGKRAGFVIGSIFFGLLGGDPLKIINTAIDRDIEAQRSEHRRLGPASDATGKHANTMRGIWSDIRAKALTDDQAVLQAKNAYLESFKQHVIAGLHERGIAEMSPMHQKLLADLDAQKAQNTFRIQQQIAANTKYVHSKVYAIPDAATRKSLRRLGEKEYEAGIGDDSDTRKSGRDLQNTMAAQSHKAQLDAPRPGELNKDDRLDIRALRADDKYSAAVDTLSHIDQLLAISKKYGGQAPDVWGPGEFGGPDSNALSRMFRSEDKEAWDLIAGNAREVWINKMTGAVAGDDQRAVAGALVGEGAMSAGERVRALETARKIVEKFILQKEGHLTESARKDLRRNPNVTAVPQSDIATDEGLDFEPDE